MPSGQITVNITRPQGGSFMDMTDKEKDALKLKLENPQMKAKCPRCGNEIIYERRGKSIAVECRSDGCIFGGIRGL